jgi:hypothetical protein
VKWKYFAAYEERILFVLLPSEVFVLSEQCRLIAGFDRPVWYVGVFDFLLPHVAT